MLRNMIATEIADAFIRAACIPMDGSLHVEGTLDRAREILAETPHVASANVHTAATLGNDAAVRQFLQIDVTNATLKGGPYGWDPLTHLCFSRFLRIDKNRSEGFISAATMLLDAGADPNTGFFSDEHAPQPIFESALYGAAGVAHHSGLTRLLLERGADPNDGETEYHAPEFFDNRPMEIIVESGKLAPMGLTTMLHRKLDWTNFKGVVWLLEHGADPNAVSLWGARALDHSINRDNALPFIKALLDFGADPSLTTVNGANAFIHAAAAGRADALELFERRGFKYDLDSDAAFLAACARGDEKTARALASEDPDLVGRIQSGHPDTVANFAGAGNTDGVRVLLDLGFDIESKSRHPGPRGNTALHLAVWRDRLPTVKLLLDRGAALESKNPDGDTALSLAALALTEMSEWTPHESTAIVDALLQAGADVSAVRRFPTGSREADNLLRNHGRTG